MGKATRNRRIRKVNQPQPPSQPNQQDVLRGMQALAMLGQRVGAGQGAGLTASAPGQASGQPTLPIVEPQRFHEEVSAALPKPNTQVVFDNRIEWTWEPQVDDIHVKAIYFKDGSPWSVKTSAAETNYDLTPEQAKAIAEAILSAVQWEHVWRQHAGDFLANGCMFVNGDN